MSRQRLLLCGALLSVAQLWFGACESRPVPLPSPLATLASPLVSPLAAVSPSPGSLPEFRLDEPVLEGSTRVTGTGPAEAPILIVNVSTTGTILGQGQIGQDGRFSIGVDSSLVKVPDLIGIMVGELAGSPYHSESQFTCTERCRDWPMIGTVYDRVVVTKP